MSDTNLESANDGEESLPSELVSALHRARLRTASPEMVDRLTARVLKITAETTPELNHRRASGNTRVYWLGAIAASIGLIMAFRTWLDDSQKQADVAEVGLLTQPVYSTITTVSLTQVGYRQVNEDLDRADAQIEEASEGIAIASVRHEIQKALEEFYDWSK